MNVAGRIPLAKIARTRRALRGRGRIKNGCRALRDRANFSLRAPLGLESLRRFRLLSRLKRRSATSRFSFLVPHSSYGSPIAGPAKRVSETHQDR